MLFIFLFFHFSLKLVSQDSNSIISVFENTRVVITANPFRIDFHTNDQPTVSINSQGLLKFEHLRKKQWVYSFFLLLFFFFLFLF